MFGQPSRLARTGWRVSGGLCLPEPDRPFSPHELEAIRAASRRVGDRPLAASASAIV